MILYLKNKINLRLLLNVSGLFLIATTVRFISLNQTPFANGWDGYYYVMQVHSFLSYGHLQSVDYSLIYPYFTIFSLFIKDYEIAFKVGTAVLSGLLTFSVFHVVYRSTKSFNLATLAAVYVIFSPGITFFVSQFPKNLLGIILLIPGTYYLVKKKYLLSVLFLVMSLLTHRMTGALGLILLLCNFIKNVSLKYVLIGSITVLLLSFLPGILHYSDFQRFNGQLTIIPQLVILPFLKLNITQGKWLWILELFLGYSLIIYMIIISCFKLLKKEQLETSRILLLVISLIIIFPFFIITYGSMGYRFFLLLPFVLPFFLVVILKKIDDQNIKYISILFLIGAFYSYKSYDPSLHDAPNGLYHSMVKAIINTYDNNEYNLVIAHKGLAEVIIYKTDFDALNWAKPSNISTGKVLRVVHGIPYGFFNRNIPDEFKKQTNWIGTNYCIMPEKNWLELLQWAKLTKKEEVITLIYQGNNPLDVRPDYLLKGKN